MRHYAIEAEIIKTMHEDTINGKYRLVDEVEAFLLIMKIIQQDEGETIELLREKLKVIDEKRNTLQGMLDDESSKIEHLDEYLAEIHLNLKQRERTAHNKDTV